MKSRPAEQMDWKWAASQDGFSEQLKAHRSLAGLSQADTAKLLDVSLAWVTKAEAGKRIPLKITQEGALARLRYYVPPEKPAIVV